MSQFQSLRNLNALKRVGLQLDYHMSSQFAGVAVALEKGLYAKYGLDLDILPTCAPGTEVQKILQLDAAENHGRLLMGVCEQYVLSPLIVQDNKPVAGIGAMLGRSPLAVAWLPPGSNTISDGVPRKIGTHADTVDLVKRLFPDSAVVAIPREKKMEMLLSGELDGVQIYDVMESLELVQRGVTPVVLPLCGLQGSNLGYAQAIFMPQSQLGNDEQVRHARAFMSATEEGWLESIKDPARSAEVVMSMQPRADEVGNHWTDTLDFTVQTVQKCNDYVKATRRGASLLTIDPAHWAKADEWILGGAGVTPVGKPAGGEGFGGSRSDTWAMSTFEPTVWKVDSNLMVGHDVAKAMLTDIRARVARCSLRRGRAPSLAIISIDGRREHGENPTHLDIDAFCANRHGVRRQQLLSPKEHSWFSRTETGHSLGIDVTTVILDGCEMTQRSLEAEVRKLREFDAIQITGPAHAHLDVEAAVQAMRPSQDVDSRGYMCSNGSTSLPLTASAAIRLLNHSGVELEGKKAVVVGKGALVGFPIVKALADEGATVSLAHSKTPRDLLEDMVKTADVIIPCVGLPGVVEASWVQPGAVVCNVGTTFDPLSDQLSADVAGIDRLLQTGLVGSCPGGVGPVVVAELFNRVAEIAELNCSVKGADENTPQIATNAALGQITSSSHKEWSLGKSSLGRGKGGGGTKSGIPVLKRQYHFPSYGQAAQFLHAVSSAADEMNHHPNIKIVHHCSSGVDVDVEVFTYVVSGITDYDFQLARLMDESFGSCESQLEVSRDKLIDANVSQFVFDLPEENIAMYPRLPRGSSRLLVHVPDRNDKVPLQQHIRAQAMAREDTAVNSNYLDAEFKDIERLLPDNAHLIFNESKVFPARLFAAISSTPGKETADISATAEPFEVMFLSAEPSTGRSEVALSRHCGGQKWRCMIRWPCVVPGTVLLPLNNNVLLAQGCPQIAMEVVQLHSSWIEEGETDGVEATVAFYLLGDRDGKGGDVLPMETVFGCVGGIPLPPYMRRNTEKEDTKNYQTVYAKECGSVAAPTAGLHFTDELLETLTQRGIKSSKVSLHVGAGTFRPITVSNVADHDMHEEQFSVSVQSIREMIRSLRVGRPLVPVGTTSVRVLESLYWLGVQSVVENENSRDGARELPLHLDQWAPYEVRKRIGDDHLPSNIGALEALCAGPWVNEDGMIRGSTSVCIVPGYRFQLCDALVTNFHQPHSTLMLLVAALMGSTQAIRSLYSHALKQDYRFLSYGDACLIYNGQGTGDHVDVDKSVGTGGTGGSFPHNSKEKEDFLLAPGTKVLLHSCCAPCSGAMIEQMHAEGHDVTIYFYNPNIHPREEYEIRKKENQRYAEKLGIPFVDADYDAGTWFEKAKGMEFDPEQGQRCSMCFDMRFERTAQHAKEHGFPVITTTNATSRWKDAEQVNASGQWAASQHEGINWWSRDWQTEEMTQRKYRINAEESFYKQEYCGCKYSLRDVNMHRKEEGHAMVKVGSGGIYSDPFLDSEEESVEKVKEFFEHTNSSSQQQLRKMYLARRKNASDMRAAKNNW